MLRTLQHGIWPPVDPALVDASRDAGQAVARTRIAIVAVLAINSAATLIRHPQDTPAALALVIEILFISIAVTILQLARRYPPAPWLGFATAAADVSFVTFCQLTMAISGIAFTGVTGRATFAFYLLAIVAGSMRNDGRVVTTAGSLAAVQWLAVAWWTGLTGSLADVVTIGAATMLGLVIAARARSLQQSSIRDNLTGLLNRAHFEDRLATELMRGARHRRPLALAILDLDQFRRVNDNAGHHAGDEMLREIAARLTRAVRRTDLTARFGSDQFAVAFIDASVADAAAKLEDIRRTLSAAPIPLEIAAVVSITCSAGVAVAPLDGHDAHSLVAVAEARLAAAKQAGCDRLMVAG